MSEFVEVLVEATGRTELVPAAWLGDPILGKGIKKVDAEPNPVPPPSLEEPSEVQLTGPVETLTSLIPAVRQAQAERAAAVAAETAPTEANTKAEIQEFADRSGIDLSAAHTKAEMLADITAHLDTDGTEPSTKTPATGDKE